MDIQEEQQKASTWWKELDSTGQLNWHLAKKYYGPAINPIDLTEDQIKFMWQEKNNFIRKDTLDSTLLCTEGNFRISANGNDIETDDSAALGICAMYANEHTEANANLIAASKDLYNSLEELRKIMCKERSENGLPLSLQYNVEYTECLSALQKANPNFKP